MMNRSDRRRVVVASAITFVALPSLWLMNRDDPTGPATVTPGGVTVSPETISSSSPVTAGGHGAGRAQPVGQRAMGTAGGTFLERPEVMPERGPGTTPTIAVPPPPEHDVLATRATFSRSGPARGACLVRDAPSGAQVTVTNVDNGRSVTCRAAPPPAGGGDEGVLHTDVYTQIARLSDAPVPVEITW